MKALAAEARDYNKDAVDALRAWHIGEAKKKNATRKRVAFGVKSLAVSYFHVAKHHTIIGAERFHFRVRKGIGWFPLAMAARQAFYIAVYTAIDIRGEEK